jgi:signal transduction histidine kinase
MDTMSHDPCCLLLVEDDPGHAELAQRVLANSGFAYDVEWVTCLADAVNRLRSARFDVLLLDLTLPDCRGLETVATLRRHQPDLPVVVLTSMSNEDLAMDLLKQGVQDYLVKDSMLTDRHGGELLARAIRYAMHRQQAGAEIQRLYRHAQRQRELLNQKNHRLGKLYSVAQKVVENVSHEFRTPLTVIKEYVSLIQEGLLGAVTTEQARYLDVVGDRTEDLSRMVEDMLDISKLDAGMLTVRRTECTVHDALRPIMPGLMRKAAIKGVGLQVTVDDPLPSVFCDVDKFGHTISNLAVNAIKFCQDQGHVQIRAWYHEEASEVVIEVSDDGPGIHDKDLARIFHRFTQVDAGAANQERGFGLGLSIARELVDLNLGQITVRSQLHEGSCFTFTLPISNPRVVADRFLKRLTRQSDRSAAVSLCMFRTDDATAEALDDFESFLYYVLRPNDLALRVDRRSWMVIMAGDAEGFEKLRRRATKTLHETNRNRIGPPLPRFMTQLVGPWNLCEESLAIERNVVMLLAQREAANA